MTGSDDRGGSSGLDAPTGYDYVLAALPAPVLAGALAGVALPVSLAAGLAAGSALAAMVVLHALFVVPPG